MPQTETPTEAEIRAAASRLTADLNRLTELSRTDSDMANMVTALTELTTQDGPLASLVTLLHSAADWLPEFEHADADAAADRLGYAADYVQSAADQAAAALECLSDLV